MKVKNNLEIKKFLLFLIFVFFVNYVFLLFTSSIGYNIQTQKYFITKLVNKISPQGWGFFTRSPREDLVDVFMLNNDFIALEFMPQNSAPSNFWGLDKKTRMKGFETSIILDAIKQEKWYNSKQENPSFIQIKLPTLHYFKKDTKYVLVKYKTIPYLWQKYVKYPPKQFIYIEIK